MIGRNGKRKLEQKLPTPASRNNGTKTDIVVGLPVSLSLLHYWELKI